MTVYVSTRDFDAIRNSPREDDYFVEPDGTLYHKLNPRFFAWVCRRYKEVVLLNEMGHFEKELFQQIESNFPKIQELAHAAHPAVELEKAIAGPAYRLPETVMYVSPLCYRWYTIEAGKRDILIGGSVFRQIDPDYYAWLRHRLVEYQTANPGLFEQVRERFNIVFRECTERFGREALNRAFKALDLKRYRAPDPALATWRVGDETYHETVVSKKHQSVKRHYSYIFPAEGPPNIIEVDSSALKKVEEIKDRALSFGWSMEALFQNRGWSKFPNSREYGVVSYLRPDDEIVEVSSDFICLRNGLGNITRIFNPARMVVLMACEASPEQPTEFERPVKKRATPKKTATKKSKVAVGKGLFDDDMPEDDEYEAV